MNYQVGMISLGCSKNQVDAERMLSLLSENGFTICSDPARCDAIIVNTCGFIEDAKRESIESIFEAAQQKKGRLKVLAVTGCLAERYQNEFADEVPEADVILGMGSIGEIAASLRCALEKGERVISFREKSDLPLEGERILANEPYFAYLKVAEGCDNRCAFCAIPDIRGHFRSMPMEKVLEEARRLADRGVVELNVVAQDTTRYGQDLYGKLMLPELLRELCKIEKIRWVRLLYCYPDRTTDELIDVIASEPKIVKYLDIPIQHCNDTILKAMNRRDTKADLLALLKKLREKVPGLVLRTSLIAGLPYEDDAAFEELCDFLREVRIERAGVFPFSPEEGTKAALMEHVDMEEAQRRAELAVDVQSDIIDAYNDSILGEEREVLCEGYDSQAQMFYGRSYAESPDIDGRIWFTANSEIAPGSFVNVRLTGTMDGETTGELV